jgi:hypothetical protein
MKVLNYTLLCLWLVALVSGFAAAGDTETYKVNTPTNLQFSCTLNNAIPSGSAVFNVSIYYQNGSYLVNNQRATSQGQGSFNYTTIFDEVSDCYKVKMFCTDGTYSFSDEGCYKINPTGVDQTTSQGIGSLSYLLIMFGLTVLIGYLGFRLSENKTLWVLGLFFIFLSLLFVVYDVYLGYEYHRNFTGMASSGIPETIFWIFMFLLIGGLIISVGLLFLRWKELARYIKKELKTKDKDDEFDKEIEDL